MYCFLSKSNHMNRLSRRCGRLACNTDRCSRETTRCAIALCNRHTAIDWDNVNPGVRRNEHLCLSRPARAIGRCTVRCNPHACRCTPAVTVPCRCASSDTVLAAVLATGSIRVTSSSQSQKSCAQINRRVTKRLSALQHLKESQLDRLYAPEHTPTHKVTMISNTTSQCNMLAGQKGRKAREKQTKRKYCTPAARSH